VHPRRLQKAAPGRSPSSAFARRRLVLAAVAAAILSGPAAADVVPTGTPYRLFDHHGGTWADAEKRPDTSADGAMCWAAAGANILE
jgi:hypothetical protein